MDRQVLRAIFVSNNKLGADKARKQLKPILGGTVFEHTIDDWQVSWESDGDYRHWCIQESSEHSDRVVIVMKNPGSLSGDGANLRRDRTLRILRIVGEAAGINWVIVNLFDYATPKLQCLHDNWDRRDGNALVYRHIDIENCRFVIFAYGDLITEHYAEYFARIEHVRKSFESLEDISIPTTKAGNPVHPMNWQRNKLMTQVIDAIKHHME